MWTRIRTRTRVALDDQDEQADAEQAQHGCELCVAHSKQVSSMKTTHRTDFQRTSSPFYTRSCSTN